MKLPDSSWPESGSNDGALQHRLAEALGDAAMHLAAHDQRIDRLADVVGDAVAHDGDVPVSGSISTSAMWQPFGKVCTLMSATSAASSVATSSPRAAARPHRRGQRR